jgi:Cation transport ATPase
MAEWHELSGADVLNRLETGRQGIDGGDARARLDKYGENVLEDNGRLQWWQVFLSQV